MDFSLTADDGVSVYCSVCHEGLAVKDSDLDGPPLGLEKAVDSEGESLIDFVVLLQPVKALRCELLIRNSELDRWFSQLSLLGELCIQDCDFKYSDEGICASKRGRFRLWPATHIILFIFSLNAPNTQIYAIYIKRQGMCKVNIIFLKYTEQMGGQCFQQC